LTETKGIKGIKSLYPLFVFGKVTAVKTGRGENTVKLGYGSAASPILPGERLRGDAMV